MEGVPARRSGVAGCPCVDPDRVRSRALHRWLLLDHGRRMATASGGGRHARWRRCDLRPTPTPGVTRLTASVPLACQWLKAAIVPAALTVSTLTQPRADRPSAR